MIKSNRGVLVKVGYIYEILPNLYRSTGIIYVYKMDEEANNQYPMFTRDVFTGEKNSRMIYAHKNELREIGKAEDHPELML